MGKVFGLFLILFAVATVVLFVGQEWVFGHRLWWFPENISQHGQAIDDQFNRTLWVVGVAFVAAQVALGYIVFRFGRRGSQRAQYVHGSNKLEVIWTLVTAVVFVSVAILGQKVWSELHLHDAPADAVKINVVAQQFSWTYHYPGADGIFGKTNPKMISESNLNFVGLDSSDPSAKDDIQVATLAIPLNKPVELTLRSNDVIHSFFVPVLRFKQDTVPGLAIKVHFTATKVGKYEMTCAELCGMNHFKMNGFVLVLPEEEFQKLSAMPEEDFKGRLTELMQQYN